MNSKINNNPGHLAADFFEKYEQIIIVVQKSNDLDSCSTALALAKLLENTYPEKYCRIEGVTIKSAYLTDMKNYCLSSWTEVDEKKKNLAVIVDINSFKQIRNPKILEKCSEILKIDHHSFDEMDEVFPENLQKITVDYSNQNYSSCCELLWDLVKDQKGWKMTPEIAEILFLGLYADNQDFLSAKTNRDTFRIISEMYDKGVDVRNCIKTLRQNEFEHSKLFSAIIQKATKEKNLLVMSVSAEIVMNLFPWNFFGAEKGKLRQKKLITFPLNMAQSLIKANTYIYIHYSLFDPLNTDKKFIFIALDKENPALERVLVDNEFKKHRNRWSRNWTFREILSFIERYKEILIS